MISVIVPVYNIEAYIDRCVESITNQSYKDLQIILVDDGSTDGSAQKCDDWAKKDARIQVIHKANGGVSSARNAGLDVATGEYLSFVDGDDWLESEMYRCMLDKALTNDCDAVFCGYRYVDDLDNSVNEIIGLQRGLYDNHEALGDMLTLSGKANYQIAAWNKLFRRDIVGNTRFDTKLTYGEDGLFTIKAIVASRKIYLEPTCFYNYLLRQGSATHTIGLTRQRIDNVKAWIKIVDCLSEQKESQKSALVLLGRIEMPILIEAYMEGDALLVDELVSRASEGINAWLANEYTPKSTRIKNRLLQKIISLKMPVGVVKIISRM